jgi:hypothetical protein
MRDGWLRPPSRLSALTLHVPVVYGCAEGREDRIKVSASKVTRSHDERSEAYVEESRHSRDCSWLAGCDARRL